MCKFSFIWRKILKSYLFRQSKIREKEKNFLFALFGTRCEFNPFHRGFQYLGVHGYTVVFNYVPHRGDLPGTTAGTRHDAGDHYETWLLSYQLIVLLVSVKCESVSFLNNPAKMREENFASNYDIFTGKTISPQSRIDGTSPFTRLPCKMSLEIISHVGLPAIYDALSHCANLRKVSLSQSSSKRVFTDYGEHVQYACVGPQPSRISNSVLDNH